MQTEGSPPLPKEGSFGDWVREAAFFAGMCSQAPAGLPGAGCKMPPSSAEENRSPVPRADLPPGSSELWEVLGPRCLHEGRITSRAHSRVWAVKHHVKGVLKIIF